ncbi:putative ATP-dependent RNA helicase (Hrh1) [Aspergillus homomorphus CBS 101889]|uniref:RNA helicase n=1 Tax=Aspergillus homomorphus (strain CBS 101889) TaxID=1450537 RepID=A0A395I5J7_ASPHC|nr:P-loop containing nucleoside triphosphate hydrolase protein [Aspergillus homomorphus CBS 101889]RAL15267.1 P-loop containing nucleoside triphosphate hydrolase protein [Aspergillus homomorphus CBS 101889]
MPERVRTVFDDEDNAITVSSRKSEPQEAATQSQSQSVPTKRKESGVDDTEDGVKKQKKNKKRKVGDSNAAAAQESGSATATATTKKTKENRGEGATESKPVESNGVNGDGKASGRTKKQKHNLKEEGEEGPDHNNRKPLPHHRNNNNSNNKLKQGLGGAKNNYGPLREKAQALYHLRKNLPIFPHADEIRAHLRRNDVMLLIGETGSGKSTQIPQFLVTEKWCRSVKTTVKAEDGSKKEVPVGGCIAITQPRRVAAISLARRVAEEMGTPLGNSSPASKVGYAVRFDTSTSPSTQVKFLTEGMLLQEMLHDPWLTKYSAIVVDEVHERGVNVDQVLGFLRNMVSGKLEGRGGVPLKVVVMSATVDMESLMGFFKEGLQPRRKKEEEGISACHIKGRQFPVKVIYSPEPVHDFVDAALKVIFNIHYKEPLPGDILVFLTGQETVEALENLVNEYAVGMDPALPKIQVLPLFAALPQAAQQRVFLPAPPRTRKIILATNIAETSVTVSGVRHVVDCGKAKVKQFRSRLGLDSLLVKPISKSAAIQRKGRAGREAPGSCYRLYTEKDYLALDETNTPEILRCDLSQALLNMKARGVDDIMGFPFLTRPPRESLEKALLQLLSIDALEETGQISSIGKHIAKLPLTPTLGRVLLAASEFGTDCLLDVIDVISCLSVENIFLNTTSEEKKEEAEVARRDLYRREGDHLTMLATVQAYAAENTDRKAWAERHLVSHRAMQSVMDVRKQLTAQCRQAKLLPNDTRGGTSTTSINSSSPMFILKSFLRGFATNTARLVPDGSYRTVVGNQTVAIHPSSVLFGKKVEAILYNEFVFTNRSYARGVSAVQMDWVGEALSG